MKKILGAALLTMLISGYVFAGNHHSNHRTRHIHTNDCGHI